MELIQKAVQASVETSYFTHQFHLGEDMNVPDTKLDIVRIVQSDGEIHIKDIVPMEQYLKVKGEVEYHLLYITDNEDKRMSHLSGKIAMEELIYMEGDADSEYSIRCNQLELQGNMIHSRKIGLEAFVELEVEKRMLQKEQMTVDVASEVPVYKKHKKIHMLQMHTAKKETHRIKEQIKLPGTKENVGELLVTQLGCYSLDTRANRDEIQFHGEFQVFCMYITDQWKEDWHVQTIPFDGKVECYGLEEGMYHTIQHTLEELSIDVQMDEDGEMRTFVVEASLQMEIRAYEESEQEVIEDMYALSQDCQLKRRNMYLESLVVQKQSRCKVVESLSLPELKDELLQICNSNGKLQIEKLEIMEEGISIEGILHVEFFYIKGDDEVPYAAWKGMVPFTHVMECANECAGAGIDIKEIAYTVYGNLEQVSVSMTGNEEIDIKAVVNFNSLIRKPHVLSIIDAVELKEFTKEELENQAGIIGYIYKEEDDLWDLSKQYHTTTESILKINKLTEKEIKRGRKLLIFKENVSIL